jgi:signal peptidase
VVSIASFVAFVAVLVITWPQTLGGKVAYVKVSGHSMETTLHLGDLVVVRAHAAYHVGDVVAYHVPHGQVGAGVLVIHRIVGGDAHKGFVTRGDNNHYDDPWRPRPAEIVGARWVRLPGIADLFARLRGPLPLAAFAALLTMLGAAEACKGGGRRSRTRLAAGAHETATPSRVACHHDRTPKSARGRRHPTRLSHAHDA